ncbi:MAG: hypothetical protein WC338_04510 [Candidatus Ratteibacteria bacterium]|jgi:hypothetical protein
MNILGIRCSNKNFSYVVMNGSKKNPVIVASDSLAYPKNFARPRSLLWFTQEVEQLIKKHDIGSVVMKRFEGRSRGGSFEERVECEAMGYLVCAKCGITAVRKKVKSTIAKDFGLKGRAHYLETGLDVSVIPAFSSYADKEQEAVLCAWSELK